jgi:DNA (cytosine-5)-methyltransferase 1
MSELTVSDFYCGAGGFSEGFRQQGFKIILGIDSWKPAIETFNYNFGLECEPKNMLDFENSIEEIEALPDTHIIIGSPPCVSFSNSNKSGKADKSMGLRLTEALLRIVAVKKHKPNSKLKAWFLENVANSRKYLPEYYTFNDLKLTEWAKNNNIDPNKVAIKINGNNVIMNSADYGSPQIRKRLIAGEIIRLKKLVIPKKTNKAVKEKGKLPNYITINDIKELLPKPNRKNIPQNIIDPLYKFSMEGKDLTDQFYDTGIYEHDWRMSEYLKTNHPYMGKMSFPEKGNAPSRTVTATKIGSSREALIYLSEYKREGHGKYRTATVREAATFMGFPITYQFVGAENSKWRLVGNAVCPSISRALAKEVRKRIRAKKIRSPQVVKQLQEIDDITNLNTFQEKKFDKPFTKKKGSRFRRHPFKDGNLTVTLSNYDIKENGKKAGKWKTSIQYGTGDGFPTHNYADGYYETLKPVILKLENGEKFVEIMNNGFSEKIADGKTLQEIYETQKGKGNFVEPTKLVLEISEIINRMNFKEPNFKQNGQKIFNKAIVPKKQLFALYAINKLCTTANK